MKILGTFFRDGQQPEAQKLFNAYGTSESILIILIAHQLCSRIISYTFP